MESVPEAECKELRRRGSRVCVTGGNGFIGSHLVLMLLEKGYDMNVTIQDDPSHPVNVAHILPPPNPQAGHPRLSRCFPSGLSLYPRGPAGPLTQLVHPAVQGTINVLEASRAANSVRRVILTSSISAMVPNPKWPLDKVVDEDCWTDVDFCKERKKFYPVSKTMAEGAAWDYSKQYGIDVVAIHPSTCLGRLLQPRLNASSAVLLQILQGSRETQEYHWLGCVHVRDVARAQILLYETPTACGRYLCTNGIHQFRDFAKTVAKICPDYPVHRCCCCVDVAVVIACAIFRRDLKENSNLLIVVAAVRVVAAGILIARTLDRRWSVNFLSLSSPSVTQKSELSSQPSASQKKLNQA